MPSTRPRSPDLRKRNTLRRHPYGRMTTESTQIMAISIDTKSRRYKECTWPSSKGDNLNIAPKNATDRKLMGRGYRPDITQLSDRTAFEYGGPIYYNEIDRLLYRLQERKTRRVAGLPAGAHVDDIPLRELMKKNAKDPARVGNVRFNEEGEDELALLRYD